MWESVLCCPGCAVTPKHSIFSASPIPGCESTWIKAGGGVASWQPFLTQCWLCAWPQPGTGMSHGTFSVARVSASTATTAGRGDGSAGVSQDQALPGQEDLSCAARAGGGTGIVPATPVSPLPTGRSLRPVAWGHVDQELAKPLSSSCDGRSRRAKDYVPVPGFGE